MPQMSAPRQSSPPPMHAIDVLTQQERDLARQRLEAAFYLRVRPAGAPEFDQLSSAQRRLLRNALDIAERSIDPARLLEGAF